MNDSSTNSRRRRADRRASSARRPKRRRLAFEQVESRLLLTGNNLDADTFNMDFLGNGYAIIAPSDDGVSVTITRDAVDHDSTSAAIGRDAISGSTLDYLFRFSVTHDATNFAEFKPSVLSTLPGIGSIAFDPITMDAGTQLKLVRSGGLFGSDLVPTSGLASNWTLVLVADVHTLSGGVLADRFQGHSLDLSGLPIDGALRSWFNEHVYVEPGSGAIVDWSTPLAGGSSGDSQTLATLALPTGSTGVIGQYNDTQTDVSQPNGGLWTQDSLDIDQWSSDQDETPVLNGGSPDGTRPEVVLTTSGTSNGPIVAHAPANPHEGGMIPVQQIVGELARSTTLVAAREQRVAADQAETEITGEITRVAVMELIAGETEPAAPPSRVDHVSYLAAVDATHRGDADWAARLFAKEAHLAATIALPVSPVSFAAVIAETGGTFSSLIGAGFSAAISGTNFAESPIAEAARSAAFSDWGADESDSPRAEANAVAWSDTRHWLDSAAPILMALACERVVAVKRKRREREAARVPVKRASATSDAH